MTSETMENIVAALRTMAKISEDYVEKFSDPALRLAMELEAKTRKSFADRIEAAWKRERESLLTKQGENVNRGSAVYTGENKGGNAAAMREALEELMKFTCNSCERRLCEEDAEEEDGQRVPSLCSAIIRARNALAEPPRNCDLYDNVEDAWQAYKQFREQTGEAIYFDMVHFWPFANWLFALAAERKGRVK